MAHRIVISLWGVALLALQLLTSTDAFAHAVGTSYIAIEQEHGTETLHTRIDVNLRDLDFAVGLDANGDGRVTWGEVLASSPTTTEYIVRHINISRGGERCALTAPDIAVDRHADEIYAVVTLQTECRSAGVIQVESNLLFELDDSHRSLLAVNTDSGNAVTVLTTGSRTWTETRSRAAAWHSLLRFISQGIWHIWIGFDHLAFLLLLLLPISREAAGISVRGRIQRILKVVTAFTAAHSLTLACAALGYVQLPSRWTEAAITASIVVAAIANLMHRTDRFGLAMAFGFGLIHGLGFASALADIATTTVSRVLPLIGFNLGVELGQLAVVAVLFPLLFRGNHSPQFWRHTVTIGSAAMGLLGVAWLVQRTLLV